MKSKRASQRAILAMKGWGPWLATPHAADTTMVTYNPLECVFGRRSNMAIFLFICWGVLTLGIVSDRFKPLNTEAE